VKNILIIVDSHNDLDHALPLIFYLNKRKDIELTVVATSIKMVNSCNDFVRYLNKELNVKVHDINQILAPLYVPFIKTYISMQKSCSKHKSNPFYLPILFLISILRPLILLFSRRSLVRLFSHFKPSYIMMDFGKEITIHGRNILYHSRLLNIPVIGYLHGYSVYTNKDPLVKDKSDIGRVKKAIVQMIKDHRKRTYCDCYLVGVNQKNTYFSTSMMGNYESSELHRVYELGLPRYCREWIKIYRDKIVSSVFNHGDTRKVNVVLFLSHPKYNVNLTQLYDTINLLSKIETINFIFKPHPRVELDGVNIGKESMLSVSYASSIQLSEWADIGIVFGSSIAFQLLLDKVALIVPSYLHSNRTIFEKNNVCISVDNEVELEKTLRLTLGDINNLLDQSLIDEFIDKIIYGGCKSFSALMDEYFSKLINCKVTK
jgi:hypothetical protein